MSYSFYNKWIYYTYLLLGVALLLAEVGNFPCAVASLICSGGCLFYGIWAGKAAYKEYKQNNKEGTQ